MDKENLKARKNELEKELRKINREIDDIEKKKELPSIKKMYEGKYFKFRNCYSCPKSDSDYWYMYIRVTKVDSLSSMEGNTFQIDSYGKAMFEKDTFIAQVSCEQQITEKEFNEAFKKFMEYLQGKD